MMKSVLHALESHDIKFPQESASLIGQIIVSLDLSGNMLTKTGKPSLLLRACAEGLHERVADLTKDELYVLNEALETINKNALKGQGAVQSLKERIHAVLI